MRVLLVRNHDIGNINTRLPDSVNRAQGIYPPLGIAYVAAVLRNLDYDVKILDSQALNLTKEETKKEIERIKPDVVGATCMTPTIYGAIEVLRSAKEIDSDIKTIIGGPGLFAYPKESVSHNCVDFGIAGEGDAIMPLLLEFLLGKRIIKDVPGLIFKNNGDILYNSPNYGPPKELFHSWPKTYIENIDEIPFPARDLLPNEKYFSILSDYPFTTMITSRGCPFTCGYCFRRPGADRIARLRSTENVMQEIEECLKMGFKEIWFYDDTFSINRNHALNICKEIVARGLDFKWQATTRVDCVDLELLKWMKKAGCFQIRYGVESGDPEILQLMKKMTTIEKVRKAIAETKRVGINCFCFFMLGYPGENEKTMWNTINLAKELNPNFAMFSTTTPYPLTDLLELSVKHGLLKDPEYWKKFTLGEVNGRIPYEFPGAHKWTERAYKQYYFRLSYVLNVLKNVRSLKQFKNYFGGMIALIKYKAFDIGEPSDIVKKQMQLS